MPSPQRYVPAAICLFAAALPAQSFVNFESGPVQSVRLAPDGSRLFVADTVGGNLVVFDLGMAAAPVLLAEIAVGRRQLDRRSLPVGC